MNKISNSDKRDKFRKIVNLIVEKVEDIEDKEYIEKNIEIIEIEIKENE